jgi:ketosteroid isomerase-like protein
MNLTFLRAGISSLALVVSIAGPAIASPGLAHDDIAAAIKADVRDIASGINTRDANLATAHDAPNIIAIQNNQKNTVGKAVDASGFKEGFASDPTWRVSLVEETVDVAEAGDLAVYRSIYDQDSTQANVLVTQKVNFIAGWSRHENGTWAMDWYVVSEIEKPHKK